MTARREVGRKASAEYVPQSLTLEALLPHFEAKLPITEVYGLAITLVASIFQLSEDVVHKPPRDDQPI